ncbi:MAG: excinuclease ABC subunit C [Candidatus Marinimicrobia bacterium CG08_land_8_20_14_0_20_45_22]|nr:MAG: excinuclease ABC subunit C [Candidatus Marinimicrobia bacterium CG08_land_8_20_14_0_20_45_22]
MGNSELQTKIKDAPVDPGCYLYKNSAGKIIYVGKAKILRNRVRSYFSQSHTKDPKTLSLVAHIADVEFIVTHSEVEALILENTLIKKHRPKYNIFMKDDKTFPYLKITNELFPQIFVTRKLIKDSAKYFGPYTDSSNMKEVLRIIKKLFAIRDCSFKLDEETVQSKKVRLCLNYHIHRCDGPCQGLISPEDYGITIQKIAQFLRGKTTETLEFFRQKMETAAKEMKFEIAAKYRDSYSALQNYSSRQSVEFNDQVDRDLLAIVTEEEIACAVVFRIREGKLVGKDSFFLEGVAAHEPSEVMQTFIQQYYEKALTAPQEVLINIYPKECDLLKEWLSELRGTKVAISKPAKEERLQLMKMAERNASLQIKEILLKKSQKEDYTPKSLIRLQTDLMLANLPRRIEAFDISNIRGKFAVGSLVTFVDAKAKKSDYRRFKIKTVEGINDFSMMAEVIKRRYSRQVREANDLPDLILIDGGKGQLSAGKQALMELNLDSLPVAGIAKRLDEIFVPNRNDPFLLRKDSPSLILLQKIRNEAHRFAITYHRKLRGKGEIGSELDRIVGLGAARKKELWAKFKTISAMKSASVADYCEIKGVGPKLAQKIWDQLHR